MSIATDKAYKMLGKSGGLAGAIAYRQWRDLAFMSKRELIEIALRLGGLCTDECDDAQLAFNRVIEEHSALKANKIL